MGKKEKYVCLCYEPSRDKRVVSYNPLCIDYNVHIRFKDFTLSENSLICGFEDKLNFLLTHLFCFGVPIEQIDLNDEFNGWKINKKYVWEKYVEIFKNTSEYQQILDEIRNHFSLVTDIELLPFYSKKGYDDPWRQFGTPLKCLFSHICSSSPKVEYLKNILSFFDISLSDYLFNDGIFLQVLDLPDNFNTKYTNKKIKKDKKQKEISLW